VDARGGSLALSAPVSSSVASDPERDAAGPTKEPPPMADQTTSSILISAEPAAVMAVIADFDAYPEWAKGVKSAEVIASDADGRAEQVAFVLDAAPIKDEYTLAYEWDGDAQVTWSLVKARMLKSMEGAYVLQDKGGETEVTYQLAVDLTIPMIGMLKRKGEKVIIDTALTGLKKRVESQS
jgi:ribosome-associated toxin RatA of RatAB toxin-antitoxin module